MRMSLSRPGLSPTANVFLRIAIVSAGALGASGPALAGCGVSSYQNYGVHSATAASGVHTATSNPPAGSTHTPGMSSCPTATVQAMDGGGPASHGLGAHAGAGSVHAPRTASTNAAKTYARTARGGSATGAPHANVKKTH